MMRRRGFLSALGQAAAGALLTGCRLEWWVGYGVGRKLPNARYAWGSEEAAATHLLNRVTFGPRPGDARELLDAKAREAFIERQLQPDAIEDTQAELLTRRLESLTLNAPDIYELSPEQAATDLRKAAILRATYSERQLYEVMVEFWNDHFNIYMGKGDCAVLKIIDERTVIRPHALGNFKTLLKASATSPCMLVYLDGAGSSRTAPNENYARELLELHTLGVAGGYTQEDVQATARALTGWQIQQPFWKGRVKLDATSHDPSPKIILGHRIENEDELEQIATLLTAHPSTARFMALKLCRRFIADRPDPAVVERVASAFQSSGGDIAVTLRAIFSSTQFQNAPPKFKRPFRYVVSALRATGATTDGGKHLQQYLKRMGHLNWDWPTPDGYPEQEQAWSSGLLERWNFASALSSNRIKGTKVDLPASALPAHAESILCKQVDETVFEGAEGFSLLLASPDFQYF